jgi:hypothetical protein
MKGNDEFKKTWKINFNDPIGDWELVRETLP